VEAALGRVLRCDPAPAVTAAGRTDAGVHARGQVAHVDVAIEAVAAFEAELHRRGASSTTAAAPEDLTTLGLPIGTGVPPGARVIQRSDEWLAAILRRLSGVLATDVRVHTVSVAPEGFDARFSALWRRYGYRVCDAPGGVDPLRRGEVLWHNRPLDVDLLNAAAARLVGEHDFAAFCKKREGATTIRDLRRLDWVRGSDGVILATVVADAFCHSMVRALVGSLLAVGEGRRSVEWPGEVLARAVRDSGVHVAPAHGLTLEEVRYPLESAELARRAAATRRIRTLNS